MESFIIVLILLAVISTGFMSGFLVGLSVADRQWEKWIKSDLIRSDLIIKQSIPFDGKQNYIDLAPSVFWGEKGGVKIFNRALTQKEIYEEYEKGE